MTEEKLNKGRRANKVYKTPYRAKRKMGRSKCYSQNRT